MPTRHPSPRRRRRPPGVPPDTPPFVLRHRPQWRALSALSVILGAYLLVRGGPLLSAPFVILGITGLWLFNRPIYVWPVEGQRRRVYPVDEETAAAFEAYMHRYGPRRPVDRPKLEP